MLAGAITALQLSISHIVKALLEPRKAILSELRDRLGHKREVNGWDRVTHPDLVASAFPKVFICVPFKHKNI
jgi:hypothetical protein